VEGSSQTRDQCGIRIPLIADNVDSILSMSSRQVDRTLSRFSVFPPGGMNGGVGIHALKGTMKNYYSVKVNGNWGLTFAFEGQDAVLVDYYMNYH